MEFYRPQLSQKSSNDKDNDEQDVSSLAFFPKDHLVNRLFKFRIFVFRTIFVDFDLLVKIREKVNF